MLTRTEWETCQAGTDPLAREEVLTRHLRLVHHVARQLVRSSRVDVDFDDLLSAGTIGLIDAVDHFDATRGLAFSTFAAPRIRGAMLDDLRKRDHVPRSVRRKQRDLARARESLRAVLDRQPTDQELADEMEIDLRKLWRWEREAEHASRVSLQQPTDLGSGTGATTEELLAGETGDAIENFVNAGEETRILRQEILNLKEQERLVLSLYYFEGLKLHEIATILGRTESRISQIRTRAIANLRVSLGHLRKEACA